MCDNVSNHRHMSLSESSRLHLDYATGKYSSRDLCFAFNNSSWCKKPQNLHNCWVSSSVELPPNLMLSHLSFVTRSMVSQQLTLISRLPSSSELSSSTSITSPFWTWISCWTWPTISWSPPRNTCGESSRDSFSSMGLMRLSMDSRGPKILFRAFSVTV